MPLAGSLMMKLRNPRVGLRTSFRTSLIPMPLNPKNGMMTKTVTGSLLQCLILSAPQLLVAVHGSGVSIFNKNLYILLIL